MLKGKCYILKKFIIIAKTFLTCYAFSLITLRLKRHFIYIFSYKMKIKKRFSPEMVKNENDNVTTDMMLFQLSPVQFQRLPFLASYVYHLLCDYINKHDFKRKILFLMLAKATHLINFHYFKKTFLSKCVQKICSFLYKGQSQNTNKI